MKYTNSESVVAMVWEVLSVMKTGRVLLGETKPIESKPGTMPTKVALLHEYTQVLILLEGRCWFGTRVGRGESASQQT